jgi:hypothetical protein
MLEELLNEIGINEEIKFDEITTSRIILDKINKYFYQKKKSEDDYISNYHTYWKNNHKDILNLSINEKKAYEIARRFNEIFNDRDKYNYVEISPRLNRNGLSVNNIANVRFFTAIQDFKVNIYKNGRDPFQQYLMTPEWFDAKEIIYDESIVNKLLKYLDADGSQGDKRQKWMINASKFLLERCDGDAYKIFNICGNDVLKVRNLLADEMEIGYSRKKADMFIRDMLDWRVWQDGKNIDKLNVASDTNTMRIALRTGLLETSIPLLASYLDVYCYQYGLVDNKTQEAWRCVWEKWKEISTDTCPPTPASMDYMIYKSIGKAYCLMNARKCNSCFLNDICPEEKRNLKPPKSISIKGMTGWESGITDEGGGGGIMA